MISANRWIDGTLAPAEFNLG